MVCTLGIDLGTSSVKVLLMDERGRVVQGRHTEYRMLDGPVGWAEQDPQGWWSAVVSTVRAVLGGARSTMDLAAIGLSGQMHGTVFLGPSGTVLRPCITWVDQRAVDECAFLRATFGSRIESWTGNSVLPGLPLAKALWVARHEPDVVKRTARLLLPKDFIQYKLTGRMVTDESDASGTGLYSPQLGDWVDELVEAAGLRRAQLPEAVPAVTVVGGLQKEAADALGVREGIPVVAGAADMAAGLVGSGAVAEGVVVILIGTAGQVLTTSGRYWDAAVGQVYGFRHAVPGKFFLMGSSWAAGLSLRWFRDALGEHEVSIAAATGADPYEVLTREASEAPPGSEGLVFLPYLAGCSTPHMDPVATGCFVGLTPRHGRPHLVRAILEGVAYSLRDSVEVFGQLHLPVRDVRMGGGGAKSQLWRTILANVLGQAVRRLGAEDASTLGAAMIAAVGSGVLPDFEAVGRAVQVAPDVDPADPGLTRAYSAYYGVYRRLYPDLRAAFQELATVRTCGRE